MMKKIKCRLLSIFLVMLFGASGCSRDTRIMYFDSSSAEAVYEQTMESGTEGAAEPQPAEELPETSGIAEEQICVHVCGQVCRPGIVMLPVGSRAWEAVEAAGGLTQEAQEEAVNLAALLQDGEKLYIPAMGEELPEAEDEAADDGLVNLNTADAKRLQTLPGIGESRAADIIAYREKNGGFKTPEEIMQVSGIKESIYEKIRDKITVD